MLARKNSKHAKITVMRMTIDIAISTVVAPAQLLVLVFGVVCMSV
jgi:hypothetical protein